MKFQTYRHKTFVGQRNKQIRHTWGMLGNCKRLVFSSTLEYLNVRVRKRNGLARLLNELFACFRFCAWNVGILVFILQVGQWRKWNELSLNVSLMMNCSLERILRVGDFEGDVWRQQTGKSSKKICKSLLRTLQLILHSSYLSERLWMWQKSFLQLAQQHATAC